MPAVATTALAIARPEPRRLLLEGRPARSISLWSILDVMGGSPEGIDPAEIASGRMLLTQRYGAFPDAIWDELIDDITRRGWSTPHFAWVVRQVLRRPYRTWNAADFDDPVYDLTLYDHAWVHLETERDRAAMMRMQGYRVVGYDGVWYRWVDERELPRSVCELVWDHGHYVGAPQVGMSELGAAPVEMAETIAEGDPEGGPGQDLKQLADSVAEAIRALADTREVYAENMRLRAEVARLKAELELATSAAGQEEKV